MRKVLLATTALVAMSVTAAQADVSVGGTAVFENRIHILRRSRCRASKA